MFLLLNAANNEPVIWARSLIGKAARPFHMFLAYPRDSYDEWLFYSIIEARLHFVKSTADIVDFLLCEQYQLNSLCSSSAIILSKLIVFFQVTLQLVPTNPTVDGERRDCLIPRLSKALVYFLIWTTKLNVYKKDCEALWHSSRSLKQRRVSLYLNSFSCRHGVRRLISYCQTHGATSSCITSLCKNQIASCVDCTTGK